jgi:hypothetical protein
MDGPVTNPFERQEQTEEYRHLRARYQVLREIPIGELFEVEQWLRAFHFLHRDIFQTDFTVAEVTR